MKFITLALLVNLVFAPNAGGKFDPLTIHDGAQAASLSNDE